jgi:hypothetical protein
MRRAVLVGIDEYDTFRNLSGCIADAISMRELLKQHENGSPNYSCRLLTSADSQPITRATLRKEWQNLFREFTGEALFYFSGHGHPSVTGGYLVTQDATAIEPGLPMSELLQLATQSKAREILIILDCCFAGDIGDVPNVHLPGGSSQAQLRQGMTILAAAGSMEYAKELGGHGVFTSLVMSALAGGAADVRGHTSAASVYGYVEQALGPWDQRPLSKSYADHLPPIRLCKPAVADEILRVLPDLFPTPDALYRMAPSHEFTHESANPDHVLIFNKFKLYRNAGLLRTVNGDDLFFAALNSNCVELTPLGKFYWTLAKKGQL